MTVLFADLSGSTALGEQLDPEDVRYLQGELFELVNTEMERFGGVTEKFVGDAIVAVFGIPRAHEDDPERAVRAALAVQESFPRFAASVGERFGVDVGLRVGVNTGEVVAGRDAAARGELMVSGDAVNVAARLQQAAEPGQVLVGERTRRATARAASYGAELKVDAKGKAVPVSAWVAESAGPERAPRGVGGLSAPLIGREEEMAILTAVARRVVRDRAPQLVTLYGPAGVGKSRLLAELARLLPDSVVLEGRCLPYGDEISYWPIAEVAKAHAGVLESDPSATAREKIRRDLERIVGPDAKNLLAPILWTIGIELPGTTVSAVEVNLRLHDAWRRYLLGLGLGHTAALLFVVEDIHWASAEVLDLLEHLAETLAETPILIVCTSRMELLETRPTWGAGKRNVTALTLAPLSAMDATELVNALLRRDGPLGAVGDSVLERAEGNPFFVEEMLEMLIERGALVRRNGGWDVSEELAELPLPDSVHGVIAARIDLLEPEPREALRRCSVVGRVFWPAAAGASDEAVLSLTSGGLVSEQPASSMAGMREFAFKNALTRDVAYASLPRSERRVLHRQVAEWIQEVAPDREQEVAELAAYHYGEAIAQGEESEAVAERAARLFLTAGTGALQRAAFDTARRYLSRSSEVAVSAEIRAAASVRLGELEMLAGVDIVASLAQAEEHLEAALRIAPPDSVSVRGDALAWRSRVLWLSGRWDEALRAANDAVDALGGQESPQLARALARRSQLAMLRDRPEAEELARDALSVALGVSDRFAEINARINLITVGGMNGDAPDQHDIIELVEGAKEIGATEEAFRALVNYVWITAGNTQVDDVLRTVALGRAKLEGLPSPAGIEGYLRVSMALIHLLPAGRVDDLEGLLADVDPERMNATTFIAWAGLRAQVLTRLGDLDAAGALVEQQRELALASGEPQRIIPMACAYLPWAALTGRHDEMRAVAAATLERVGDRWAAALTALPAVRALGRASELDLLQQWHDLGRARRGVTTRSGTTTTTASALIAIAEGRFADAVPLLTEVASAERSLGYDFDAAAVELDLADALEGAGEHDQAMSLRASSEAFFASIGCKNPL